MHACWSHRVWMCFLCGVQGVICHRLETSSCIVLYISHVMLTNFLSLVLLGPHTWSICDCERSCPREHCKGLGRRSHGLCARRIFAKLQWCAALGSGIWCWTARPAQGWDSLHSGKGLRNVSGWLACLSGLLLVYICHAHGNRTRSSSKRRKLVRSSLRQRQAPPISPAARAEPFCFPFMCAQEDTRLLAGVRLLFWTWAGPRHLFRPWANIHFCKHLYTQHSLCFCNFEITDIHFCTHLCTVILTKTFVHIFTHLYTFIHPYLYTFIHIYTHLYTCIYAEIVHVSACDS